MKAVPEKFVWISAFWEDVESFGRQKYEKFEMLRNIKDMIYYVFIVFFRLPQMKRMEGRFERET